MLHEHQVVGFVRSCARMLRALRTRVMSVSRFRHKLQRVSTPPSGFARTSYKIERRAVIPQAIAQMALVFLLPVLFSAGSIAAAVGLPGNTVDASPFVRTRHHWGRQGAGGQGKEEGCVLASAVAAT